MKKMTETSLSEQLLLLPDSMSQGSSHAEVRDFLEKFMQTLVVVCLDFVRAARLQNEIAPEENGTQYEKWHENHEKGSEERPETSLKCLKPLSCSLEIPHRHFPKNLHHPKWAQKIAAMICRGRDARILGGVLLGQTSCRTKVSRIIQIFVPNFAPNFAPNLPRIFVLCCLGNGDHWKFTKNPRHVSMPNSQEHSKKESTKALWRAGKVRFWASKSFAQRNSGSKSYTFAAHSLT